MEGIWLPNNYYDFKIAVVGKKVYFIPYRNAMVNSFKLHGFLAEGFDSVEEALGFNPQVLIIINPILHDLPPKNRRDLITVAVQTEQLHTGFGGEIFGRNHIKQLKPFLNRFDIILDWSKDHLEILQKISNAKIIYFPHSYFPELEINQSMNNKHTDDKEYDLIFIGNMPGVMDRRKKAIDFLSSIYNVYPTRNDLWFDKKAEALGNSKICINIHYEESRCMESPRLYDYFANHCFVMSEPIHSSEPFVEGRDYIEFFGLILEKRLIITLKTQI